MFATQQFLFPATKALLADPTFVGQKLAFYGGQQVNKLFAEISDTVDTKFQWPPFLDQAYNDWDETVGKSFADKTDTGAALDQWQDADHDVRQEPGLQGRAVSVDAADRLGARAPSRSEVRRREAWRAAAPRTGYLFVAPFMVRVPGHAGVAARVRGAT